MPFKADPFGFLDIEAYESGSGEEGGDSDNEGKPNVMIFVPRFLMSLKSRRSSSLTTPTPKNKGGISMVRVTRKRKPSVSGRTRRLYSNSYSDSG